MRLVQGGWTCLSGSGTTRAEDDLLSPLLLDENRFSDYITEINDRHSIKHGHCKPRINLLNSLIDLSKDHVYLPLESKLVEHKDVNDSVSHPPEPLQNHLYEPVFPVESLAEAILIPKNSSGKRQSHRLSRSSTVRFGSGPTCGSLFPTCLPSS